MNIKVSLKLTLLALTVIMASCDPSPITQSAVNTEIANPIETSAILVTPTLTTPTPFSSNPEDYQFAPWSADRADELIEEMENEVLGFFGADREPGDNYPPYMVAWYAAWDALERFPDDPRKETWLWKMAYYMALAGEGYESTEIYADLITDALNQEGISPQDLPGWFQSGEMFPHTITPMFILEIEPITVPGTESGYLLNIGELSNIDTPGSSCVLLVETDGVYKMHIIHNGFPEHGFWIGLRNPGRCFANDVTHDGIAEIIVDQWSGGHVGTGYVSVFDLTSLPPEVMPFSPALNDYLSVWNGGINHDIEKDTNTQLLISALLGDCWEYSLTRYEWNGAWFDVSHGEVVYSDTAYQDEYTTFSCAGHIRQYANGLDYEDAFWIYDGAYTAYLDNFMSSIEMLDEFRVLMGLTSAYQGDYEMARSIFQAISEEPTTTGSIWIEPAQEFLEAYQSPSDLFRACSLLDACAPYYAGYVVDKECVDIHLCDDQKVVEALITNVYSTYQLEQITGSLRLAGLDIRAEGWYDFDGDASDELWFSVMQPRDATYAFWIVAEYSQGIKPLLVLEELPNEITDPAAIEGSPIEVFEDFDFTYVDLFEFVRHPLTDEPFSVVREVAEANLVMQDLERFLSLRDSLYVGSDPGLIYEQLLEIENKPGQCPFELMDDDGRIQRVYDCSAFHYTLAFAAELAGMDQEAIERYFHVFYEYPTRPFALLAQAKLVQN